MKKINLKQKDLEGTYFNRLCEDSFQNILSFLNRELQGGIETWDFYEESSLNEFHQEYAQICLRFSYSYDPTNHSDEDSYDNSGGQETDNNTDDNVRDVVSDVPGEHIYEQMKHLESQFEKCAKERNENWIKEGKNILKKMFMYNRIWILAALDDCHLFRFEHHSAKQALRFIRLTSNFRGRIDQAYGKSWITFIATMIAKKHWDNEDFMVEICTNYNPAFIIYASERLKSTQSFFERVLRADTFPYATVILYATEKLRNNKEFWNIVIPYMAMMHTHVERQQTLRMRVDDFNQILGGIITPELYEDYNFCRRLIFEGIGLNFLWGERFKDDEDVAYFILKSDIGFSIFPMLSERLRGNLDLAEMACEYYSTEVYLHCTDDIRNEIGKLICDYNDVIERNKEAFVPSRELMKKCIEYRPTSIQIFTELYDDLEYIMSLISQDPMTYCLLPEEARSDFKIACHVAEIIEKKRYKNKTEIDINVLIETIPLHVRESESMQKHMKGLKLKYESIIPYYARIKPYDKHVKWTKRLIEMQSCKDDKSVYETAVFILYKVVVLNHKDYFHPEVQRFIEENITAPLLKNIKHLEKNQMVNKYFVKHETDIFNVQQPIINSIITEIIMS